MPQVTRCNSFGGAELEGARRDLRWRGRAKQCTMVDIRHDTEERRKNAIALLDADLRGLLQVKEVDESGETRCGKSEEHESHEHNRR